MAAVAAVTERGLGIGVGVEHPPEFATFGVPVEQRGARTDEALEVLRDRERRSPYDVTAAAFPWVGVYPDPVRARRIALATLSDTCPQNFGLLADP